MAWQSPQEYADDRLRDDERENAIPLKGEKVMRVSFIWNYKGHNSGIFDRGPNWWQITLPGSRKLPRVAVIVTRAKK